MYEILKNDHDIFSNCMIFAIHLIIAARVPRHMIKFRIILHHGLCHQLFLDLYSLDLTNHLFVNYKFTGK